MTPDLPILYVARFEVEALTALSAATGASDPVWDTLLVRDANDLPMLAGTALAGVIRSNLGRRAGQEAEEALFGTLTAVAGAATLEASRVAVSDGLCCGADGRVRDGLDVEERWRRDPVLALLAVDQPTRRDRVRLNEHGVVDGTGKFTRAAVPAGTRFRFQLELPGTEADEDAWSKLVEMVATRALRIGGASGTGLGLVRTVRLARARLDLRQADDRTRIADWTRLDSESDAWQPPNDFADDGFEHWVELQLAPRDFYRFGAIEGTPLSKDSKAARMLTEKLIEWPAGGGRPAEVVDRLVIPGAGVRGALRHRTLFHYRRRKKVFAGSGEPEVDVDALFGTARDKGCGGRLFVCDAYLSCPASGSAHAMPHNSIDRFTGGVRRRILFSEELTREPFTLQIGYDRPADATLEAAFRDAVDDLRTGWLGLGGGWAKGHGTFRDEEAAA